MSYAVLSDFPAPALRPRRYTPPRRMAPGRGMRRRGIGASTAQVAGSAVTSALESAGGIMLAIPHDSTGDQSNAGGLQLAGAIVAAVGAIAGPIISMFNGCGQTCVQATQYANQAAVAVQQIHDTYMAAPVHYASAQAGTLNQLQQIFDAMKNACGNPALGSAGQRCISERLVRGGTAPWCTNPGHTGCDWYTTIWDPIANDPNVVPDPFGSTLSSVFGGAAGSNVLPLVMIGGALLLLVVLL